MPPNMLATTVAEPMAEPWELINLDGTYAEMEEAGYILDRPLPRKMDALYRKFHKVKNSETTYAFGVLADNRKYVEGSQGWTVQLALQLNKKVYVYDDKTRQWYKGDRFVAALGESHWTLVNRFKPCDPPTLDQKSNISLPTCLDNHTSYELEQLLARRCSTD